MKYKIGDKVKITKATPYWHAWADGMRKFIGQTVTVKDVLLDWDNKPNYKFNKVPCYWLEESLSPVDNQLYLL